MPRAFLLLGDRLQTGLFLVSDRFVRAWGSCAGESFLVVATSPAGDDRVARWRVDLAARTVTLADASGDTGTAPGPVIVTRIGMLADLLGITSWRSAEGSAPAHAPSAA